MTNSRAGKAKLRFDGVTVGQELPPLTKTVTTRQLVMYAGASGDFVPIHYDKDRAAAAGHPKVIVHGALKSTFIAQMVTDWIGDAGRLAEFSVQYRAIDYPDEPLTCRGRVTGKRHEGTTGYIDLEAWLENSKGEITTPGRAVVALPVRPS
jgi:acyl dehydratase